MISRAPISPDKASSEVECCSPGSPSWRHSNLFDFAEGAGSTIEYLVSTDAYHHRWHAIKEDDDD